LSPSGWNSDCLKLGHESFFRTFGYGPKVALMSLWERSLGCQPRDCPRKSEVVGQQRKDGASASKDAKAEDGENPIPWLRAWLT
jgi:hypothetical protein